MRRLIAAAALLLPVAALAGAPREVAIVKSDSLAPYTRLIAGFSAECRAEVVEYDLRDDGDRASAVFEEIRETTRPALVLALGPLAANSAKRLLGDIPVLFALVPNHEKYGLEGKNLTGIALTRPVRAQLETLKALAPGAQRVGVVFNPKFSRPVVDAAAQAAAEVGIQLVPAKVDAPEDVPAATRSLGGKVDALWMIADRTVANAEATRAIIAFSIEQRVPLFALSESQVRDGALVSLAPNYPMIGQQAGRMANRIVFEGVPAASLPVAQPEGLDLAINLTTARRIGAECDLALEIFKFAARQGFPIRVLE